MHRYLPITQDGGSRAERLTGRQLFKFFNSRSSSLFVISGYSTLSISFIQKLFHTCLFLSLQLEVNQSLSDLTGWHQDHGFALQAKAMVKRSFIFSKCKEILQGSPIKTEDITTYKLIRPRGLLIENQIQPQWVLYYTEYTLACIGLLCPCYMFIFRERKKCHPLNCNSPP